MDKKNAYIEGEPLKDDPEDLDKLEEKADDYLARHPSKRVRGLEKILKKLREGGE